MACFGLNILVKFNPIMLKTTLSIVIYLVRIIFQYLYLKVKWFQKV